MDYIKEKKSAQQTDKVQQGPKWKPTNGNLFAEMIPVATDIRLHHLPTEHVSVAATIALQQSLLLLRYRGMVRLIETLLDQVYDGLALFFGQDALR